MAECELNLLYLYSFKIYGLHTFINLKNVNASLNNLNALKAIIIFSTIRLEAVRQRSNRVCAGVCASTHTICSKAMGRGNQSPFQLATFHNLHYSMNKCSHSLSIAWISTPSSTPSSFDDDLKYTNWHSNVLVAHRVCGPQQHQN